MPGSGRAGSEGPGSAIWGAPAGGASFDETWTIATTGDTPGVSTEHFVVPNLAGLYARLTFGLGQAGDSAPGAWLDDNPAPESGRSGSVAFAIAYNESPYNDPGVVLPGVGPFSILFRFTPPVHGVWPDYEWVPGSDLYFHASWASDGHTGDPQTMTLHVSSAPIP